MSNPELTNLERLEKKIDSITEILKEGSHIPKIWLRTDQACEYLSISSSQLQVLKNKGYFPVYKTEGTNYYKIEDIDAALENSIAEV